MKKLILIGFLILAVSLWTAPAALAFWNNPLAGGQIPLAGSAIPQFIDELPFLHTITGSHSSDIDQIVLNMEEFQYMMLPAGVVQGYTGTWVWGYRDPSQTITPSYIGPVIVAQRNSPTQIQFVNKLGTTATTNVLAWLYSTDQTMHWADPLHTEANNCSHKVATGGFPPLVPGGLGSTYPPPDDPCAWNYGQDTAITFGGQQIPAVVHLHGGEVPPELDGGPDAWFTSETGTYKGHGFYSKDGASATNYGIYRYPNSQEAANIWFHDHVLGITRLNVYAGLAGAYIITDPALQLPVKPLPEGRTGEPLIPLVIQDRMFDTNGQLFFPADSAGGLLWTTNPEHPYWVPEFIGDAIVVNGKTWPTIGTALAPLPAKRYRFLFLNGSNARTYELFLPTPVGILPLWVIGTDGGYLDDPVPVNKLVIMPGERYDVIIDFAPAAPAAGATPLILKNTGRTPFPKGGPPNGATVGRIVQFWIGPIPAVPDNSYNPLLDGPVRTDATQKIKRLADPVAGTLAVGVTPQLYRQLTLNEVMGLPKAVIDPVTGGPGLTAYPGGPLEVVLNNTKWSGERVVGTVGAGAVLEPITGYKPVAGGAGATGTIYYSELPNEAKTEVWEIINITADAHPIHLHLVQFQIINRQNFNMSSYMKAYAQAFGGVIKEAFGPPYNYDNSDNLDVFANPTVGGNPNINKLVKGKPAYLQGKPSPPLPQEAGWKDTVVSYPGQVLRLAVRWAPTDIPIGGLPTGPGGAPNPATLHFPFNPNGHGYVWHCHIIDHEDNEMMRPTQVQVLIIAAGTATGGSTTTLINTNVTFTEALVGSRVNNITDGSTGVITALLDSNTLTIGAGMSGPTPPYTNDAGENYEIVPNRTYVKGTHY